MKHLLIILGLFVSIHTFGQESKTNNFLSEIGRYDISDLWTLKTLQIENDTNVYRRGEPLGYIGENFYRFYIHFISVIQNPTNKLEYFVYGKTKVKNYICTFQGLISITDSRTYLESDFNPLKQGFVKGNYAFYEDPDKKETGVLKGNFQTNFYLDGKGIIKYDALSLFADDFKNNLFEGTWINYKSEESKTCNWGDFRIPNSRELDFGAGEFGVSKKYLNNGWLSYSVANNTSSSEKLSAEDAKNKENEQWWKDIEK